MVIKGKENGMRKRIISFVLLGVMLLGNTVSYAYGNTDKETGLERGVYRNMMNKCGVLMV